MRPDEITAVKEILGEGSFGVVHHVMYTRRGDTKGLDAARKQLKLETEAELKAFTEEACFLVACQTQYVSATGKHPHVLELLGVCLSRAGGERPFILTEFMRGGSLEKKLVLSEGNNYENGVPAAWKQPISWNKLVENLLQAAKGVAHLHEVGIVHSDIATRNILLDESNSAVIADVGLGALKERNPDGSSEQMHLDHGPVQWMAPEQFNHNPKKTQEADCYMFACTCWEAIVQMHPHAGQTFYQVARQQASGVKCGPMPDWVPLKLVSILKSCWQEETPLRPTMPRVVEMLTAYHSTLDGHTPDVRPDEDPRGTYFPELWESMRLRDAKKQKAAAVAAGDTGSANSVGAQGGAGAGAGTPYEDMPLTPHGGGAAGGRSSEGGGGGGGTVK